MRWIGLALLASLFFKLFYGLAPLFYIYISLGVGFLYAYNLLVWVLIKYKNLSDKYLVTLVNIMVFLDMNAIFWLGYLIIPLVLKLGFIPLTRIFNSTYFLFFLVIIAAAVILGIKESILMSSVAVLFFLLQKLYCFFNGWLSLSEIYSDWEVLLFFYIGSFLAGYLSTQAENKKNELDRAIGELSEKAARLQINKKELILLEKKASLHRLAVSLNHEINNPLTGILGNAQFFYDRIRKNLEISPENFGSGLEDCLTEARKIKELLRRLRKISEPIVSEYIPGVKMYDLNKTN